MKSKFLILLILLIVAPNIVNASECYYINNNDVCLKEKEYDFLVERFNEEFPSIMNKKDYENLIKLELMQNEVVSTFTYDNVLQSGILPFAEHYETASKSLKISKVCSSSICGITVVLEWLKSPNVRSYDVLGAYLQGTNLLTSPTTYITSSSSTTNSNEIVNKSTGFGVSLKLPSSASNIVIYQYYDTTSSGTIYQSYQHAKSNISLADSKKYDISRNGYGGVFSFHSSVKSKYDAMGGVSLSLN